MDSIPTLVQPKTIALEGGRSVKIRRAKRAQRERLIAAGNVGVGSMGGAIMTTQYAVRWGIVGFDGFKLPATESLDAGGNAKPDEAIKFAQQHHPTLGLILAEDIYDMLSDDDVNKIVVDVIPELTEESAGN